MILLNIKSPKIIILHCNVKQPFSEKIYTLSKNIFNFLKYLCDIYLELTPVIKNEIKNKIKNG